MEQEPWQYYFETFSKRAARVPQQAFGRSELLFEAAHDAYENTTNHLTGSGWGEEQALTVTRMFGQVVKEWLARGGESMEHLRDDLRRQYVDWNA
jgi:hypothetical protein